MANATTALPSMLPSHCPKAAVPHLVDALPSAPSPPDALPPVRPPPTAALPQLFSMIQPRHTPCRLASAPTPTGLPRVHRLLRVCAAVWRECGDAGHAGRLVSLVHHRGHLYLGRVRSDWEGGEGGLGSDKAAGTLGAWCY
eukprot:355715-Chlamydomonas_euryale.AAC.5